MTPAKDVLEESTVIIREIETNLERSLQKRREEIAREFEEKMRREKEEHERVLLKIEEDFAREKGAIKEYQKTISDFEGSRDQFQAEIRQHLDKSVGYQKDIERLTALTLEELRIVSDKSAHLAQIRDQAGEKISELRTKLRERYGIVTQEPSPDSHEEIVVNLEQELSKLKRIKQLLETSPSPEEAAPAEPALGPVPAEPVPFSAPEAEPAPEAESAPEAEPEPFPAADSPFLAEFQAAVPDSSAPEPFDESGTLEIEEKPSSEFRMPEINQFIEDFVRRENAKPQETVFPEPEAVPPAETDRRAVYEELNFQAVFEALEKYRKSEPTEYDGEISFFQNRDRSILDGESLIRSIGHLLEEGRKLYTKLGQTESPKDQFFLKQELINLQEVLRKNLLRAVKLCERDAYSLPHFTGEILNLGVLKNILEKLSMDNWSNDDDFRSFEAMAGHIKDAFYKRITPPAAYLRSIVQELEA